MKKKQKNEPRIRRTLSFLVSCLVLLTVAFYVDGQKGGGTQFDSSVVSTALLRWKLGDFSAASGLSLPKDETADAKENEEGTTITEEKTDKPERPQEVKTDNGGSDNGSPARTLTPASTTGYSVWNKAYVYNTTDYTLDLNALMSGEIKAKLSGTPPQVLIIHTHGTEAYTMPKGQEYTASGDYRTTDTNFNVVRVGDEIADTLENAGISVLHDRTLYDYPKYEDSYARALISIQAYLKKYPSITFILDVHRDAVTDADGTQYKVISPVEGKNAAQISIVMGSNGGGMEHPLWQENLKLAVKLQDNLCQTYPSLMRPMYLRNSRYNQHATTGSMLVEFGAAGNSLDEALYSARLFGAAAANVFKGGGQPA